MKFLVRNTSTIRCERLLVLKIFSKLIAISVVQTLGRVKKEKKNCVTFINDNL